MQLDFIIDRLTNSILNIVTGDSFETDVLRFTKGDVSSVAKKHGWNFAWSTELKDDTKEVYKLTIQGNPKIIQGLVSLSIKEDYVTMELLESAPFNIGENKMYEGVAGNLVAFVCRLSFQKGFEGNIAFLAKTVLVEHYENTLGAQHIGGGRMIITTPQARKLVERYFKK